MSKLNGDYLVNQVMMFSKFFENFQEVKDTKNMFVILHEIRVLHGMMLVKQNKIIKKINQKGDSNNSDYYDLSIFSNLIESTNELIHKYESSLFNLLEKEKVENKEEISTKSDSEIMTQEMNQDYKNAGKDEEEEIVQNKLNDIEKKKYDEMLPTLIYFFSNLDNESKNIKPIINKIKLEYKDRVNVIQVDCNKKQEICQKFSVKKFPEIKLFQDKTYHDFKGDRSFDNLKEFINSHISLN